MASNMKDPRTFFTKGSAVQYEFVLGLYEEALKLKAEQKNKNKDEFLKLDRWYQTDLPKKIKSRGKDAHLTHDELVKCMKWKLYRGKFSPRLKDLIVMNTPRLCITETKKAFRALLKRDDLSSAIQALCNLKGVGPAMASAILTAAKPESCGFMADECMMAIPEIESIDYTTRELLNFLEQLSIAAERLNKETETSNWSPHKIEQALWAHFVVADLKTELLDDMPGGLPQVSDPPTENGSAQTDVQKKNGASHSEENSVDCDLNKENLRSNGTSNSPYICEDTNDSIAPSETPSVVSEATNDIPDESNDYTESSNDLPDESNGASTDSQNLVPGTSSKSKNLHDEEDSTDGGELKRRKLD